MSTKEQPAKKPTFEIRDRIKEFRRVPAEELTESPENFREHPEEQRAAFRAILREVGYAGAALAYESNGQLVLIDGHMRKQESKGGLVPTLILDVTPDEARTLMAFYDPLGDLAVVNRDAIGNLLEQVNPESDALQVVMMELAGYSRDKAPENVPEEEKTGPPGMELRPYEHYDYVVVLARNTMDWQALCSRLGLKRVDSSPSPKVKKIGIGRAIDARELLNKLGDK